MKTPLTIAIEAINGAARINNTKRIHWAANLEVPAAVSFAIISAAEPIKIVYQIADATGASVSVLQNLRRGNKADGQKWPALRDVLRNRGITFDKDGAKPVSHIADAVPPAEFTVKATAVAPVADPITVPPATLAVTNKGEVVTAKPPTAATMPLAMVASPGGFATKTETTRSVIDPNTGDILVITTHRILYGSAPHRAKMIEMNAKKP